MKLGSRNCWRWRVKNLESKTVIYKDSSNNIGPEWLRPAFDQKFIEIAKEAGSQMEVEQFRIRQNEIERLLKDELTQTHVDLLLELDGLLVVLISTNFSDSIRYHFHSQFLQV